MENRRMSKTVLSCLVLVFLAGATVCAAGEAAPADSVRGIVTEKDGDSFKLFRVDTSEPPTTLDLHVTPQTQMKGFDGRGGIDKGAELEVWLDGPVSEKNEARALELLASADDTTANLRSAKLNALSSNLAITTQQSIVRDVALVDVRSGKTPLSDIPPSRPPASGGEYPATVERVFEETPVQNVIREKETSIAPEEAPARES